MYKLFLNTEAALSIEQMQRCPGSQDCLKVVFLKIVSITSPVTSRPVFLTIAISLQMVFFAASSNLIANSLLFLVLKYFIRKSSIGNASSLATISIPSTYFSSLSLLFTSFLEIDFLKFSIISSFMVLLLVSLKRDTLFQNSAVLNSSLSSAFTSELSSSKLK